MKAKYLFALIIWPLHIYGQIQDDFSDHNLSKNPFWHGDTSQFTINSKNQLQLNAQSNLGTAIIYTSAQNKDSLEWQLWVNMDFAPSGSNQLKIILAADTPTFQSSFKGYFLEIGESGSDDAIDLYRQDSTENHKILDGIDGFIFKGPSPFRIKVKWRRNGSWSIYADSNGYQDFVLQGKIKDSTYKDFQYFGIQCNFTSSRADKFYFDDLYRGPPIYDTAPPKLTGLSILDAHQLLLTFDESINADSLTTSSFGLQPNIGAPDSVFLKDGVQNQLQLRFSTPFLNKTRYKLFLHNIFDNSGNPLSDSVSFSYIRPGKGDLLITEFISDPDPAQGLPGYEFVEIYNNTDFMINLSGWALVDQNNTGYIQTDSLLPPHEYAVITDMQAKSDFDKYGLVLPVNDLPSLNNSGDAITLINQEGDMIDHLTYNGDWYNNPSKEEGGWSLERISMISPCKGSINWDFSNSQSGGTPGRKNSIQNNKPDTVPPLINALTILDSIHLKIEFDEPVLSNSIDFEKWSVDPVNGITSIEEQAPLIFIDTLTLANPLINKTTYTLTYNNIEDCWGNQLTGSQSVNFEYLVPEKSGRHDLLITEILADPEPKVGLPSHEFFELTNISDKILDLGQHQITLNGESFSLPSKLIKPDSIVIIARPGTSDAFNDWGQVIEADGMSALTNEAGLITLRNQKLHLIHAVHFRADWYGNNFKAEGGWSLEMKDTQNPCSEESNWAPSINPEGGTPGKPNSILVSNPDARPPKVNEIVVLDSGRIELIFNERMDSFSLVNGDYSFYPELDVDKVTSTSPLFKSAILILSRALKPNQVYSLSIDQVKDCAENKVSGNWEKQFGLPQSPKVGDLLISEILFDPPPQGSDFIEIVNNSNKIISAGNLRIGTRNDEGQVDDLEPFPKFQILPGKYIVITENQGYVLNNFLVKNPGQLKEISNLPTYSNENGNVLLTKKNGEILDEVTYHEDWHAPLVDNPEGVSLERISKEAPSNDAYNWHSAAETENFGTPTYDNSQAGNPEEGLSPFTLTPKVFSPDQDGYKDYLQIQYRLKKSGYLATMTVFDTKGRIVRKLTNNHLLGKEGNLKWDGTRDNGSKAFKGVYIVLIEAFHPNGDTETHKLVTTLGGN